MRRVDVGNGLVALEGSFPGGGKFRREIESWDRLPFLLLLKGGIDLWEESSARKVRAGEGNGVLLRCPPGDYRIEGRAGLLEFFAVFVADFYLERYRSEEEGDPLARICEDLDRREGMEPLGEAPWTLRPTTFSNGSVSPVVDAP